MFNLAATVPQCCKKDPVSVVLSSQASSSDIVSAHNGTNDTGEHSRNHLWYRFNARSLYSSLSEEYRFHIMIEPSQIHQGFSFPLAAFVFLLYQ